MHNLLSLLIGLSLFQAALCLDMTLCGATYRPPDYNDIFVTCGTVGMELSIYLCPVYYAGFNESLLALNRNFNNPACRGTVDLTGPYPMLKFVFPLNDTLTCGSNFVITTAMGTGAFKDFSNIQSVNISGIIKSNDPTVGTVSYNMDVVYLYSCTYPLEYLMNNTRLDVTGATVAVKDNNGSFVSTLSLTLWADRNYTVPLPIPKSGLYLKTKIYVDVKATNLTDKFNVILDRCYASVSAFPTNSTYYDLFVGCNKDPQTVILNNGDKQYARFGFEAFRFVEQKNLTVCTFYLHCITRLCEKSACPNFIPVCPPSRRRRDVSPTLNPDSVSQPSDVTSKTIYTMNDNALQSNEIAARIVTSREVVNVSVGLGITVGVLALMFVIVSAFAFVMYRKMNRTPGLMKMGSH
ncbi:zona pellucida-like domain-containing protein 1 [Protopterus annectens]|uniref:zona pellucida-like domain-containing protein 1 n=1 Tax=Protopterus annectens TaxID=7888 RepID=UPI001CFA9590|nr:zona pellucida-like domain-containing protein 1 [Protopterus annectens]